MLLISAAINSGVVYVVPVRRGKKQRQFLQAGPSQVFGVPIRSENIVTPNTSQHNYYKFRCACKD